MNKDDKRVTSPHLKKLIKNDGYNSDEELWQKDKITTTSHERPMLYRRLTSPAILSKYKNNEKK